MAVAVLASGLIVAAPAAGQGSAPQCSDNIDNDGDGKTDFSGGDPECVQNPAGGDPTGLSSDNSESEPGYQGFGGTPPPDGGGGFGGPCETTVGPATTSNVYAKPAGGDWQPYQGKCMIQFQEQPDPTGGTMRYLLVSFMTQDGSQDLKSQYPKGTQISIDVASSGPRPLFVLASGTDAVAGAPPDDGRTGLRALGQSFTAQLTVPTVEFSTQQGPPPYSCAPGTTQTMDFAGLVIQYQSSGGMGELMNAFDGFVVGGTFQSISFNPQALSAQGDIGVTTEGCGNVVTEITVPSDGLALGGMTQSLMNTLNSQIGDEAPDLANLNDLVDNDQQVPPQQFGSEFLTPGELAPDPVPGTRSRHALRSAARSTVGAVGIDYRSGQGSHDIETAPDTTAVKAAKKAVKKCKRGKLKFKRGKFVCKKKR